MLLPLTTQDFIIRELSPIERRLYSLTCKEAARAVQSFSKRAFKISKILSRYFDTFEQIARFRILQYTTGMLISGSSALQFFDCTVYPESDLDTYVTLNLVAPVAEFFLEAGYTFHPIKEQDPNFQTALSNAVALADQVNGNFVGVANAQGEEDWHGYMGNGITDVFSFVKDGKKIQIIVCSDCPMEVILKFHSTCVMNVISHSHAYSLFPRATFHNRVSVQVSAFSSLDHRQESPRKKYANRGWTIVPSPSTVDFLRLGSEFRPTPRCLGDPSCWTIALEPIESPEASGILMGFEYDIVRANIWKAEYGSTISLSQSLYHVPGTKFNYTYGRCMEVEDRAQEIVSNKEDISNDVILASIVHDECTRLYKPSLQKDNGLEGIAGRVRALVYDGLFCPETMSEYSYAQQPVAQNLFRLFKVLENMFLMFKDEPQVQFSFEFTSGEEFYPIQETVRHLTPCVWTHLALSFPDSFPSSYDSPIRMSTNEGLAAALRDRKINMTVKDLVGDVGRHATREHRRTGRRPYRLYYWPSLRSVGVSTQTDDDVYLSSDSEE